ncbi:MAG: amidohydrolase family protein [bacterium]|nr:amidohydrolase family protein [bacterium]
MENWDLKTQFLKVINDKGGFVSCHGHFDKANYITRTDLAKTMVDMEEKWRMSDDIKRKATPEEVESRIRSVLDRMIAQGVKLCCTFIDAYDVVGHKNMTAALKVREEYKDKIQVKLITQPLGGLLDPTARALYEELTELADIAGGLPSYDRPKDDENFDYLFSIAKNLNKPLHIHIDQENNPNERDTEKLVKFTKKHGYEGRVTAIHMISVSALKKAEREKIYQSLADTGISVVVAPAAALGMRQLDQYQAPLHNSIANVPEMLKAGVNVALGTDNIFDFYHPFVDGDLYTEMRMLQEACRYYDFDSLVDVATVNGRKILEIM